MITDFNSFLKTFQMPKLLDHISLICFLISNYCTENAITELQSQYPVVPDLENQQAMVAEIFYIFVMN